MDERTRHDLFAEGVAAANRANDALLDGTSGPLRDCFSHRDDISLFGGFGGHEVGWTQIGPRLDWVAQTFAGGTSRYEPIAAWVSGDVGVIVQFERGDARITGRGEPLRFDFRVTMAFRLENGAFRLVHRHADHLFEKQPPA